MDAGTGLLSPLSYKSWYAEFYVGKIRRIAYVLAAAATRGFTMVVFTASRRNNFVEGTCALPSALLVTNFVIVTVT